MKRALSTFVAASALTVLGTGTALASCLAPPPLDQAIEEADLVFVATVIDLANQDRNALMEVEEIWKGPDLPGEVLVRGGETDDPNMFTSVDRTYRFGVTYLVVSNDTTPPIQDNACTSTQEFTVGMDDLRPADARPPSGTLEGDTGSDDPEPGTTTTEAGVALPDPGRRGSSLVWIAVVGIAAAAGGGVTAFVIRKNRREDRWVEGFRS